MMFLSCSSRIRVMHVADFHSMNVRSKGNQHKYVHMHSSDFSFTEYLLLGGNQILSEKIPIEICSLEGLTLIVDTNLISSSDYCND